MRAYVSKRAIAIPMVVIFCGLMAVMVYYMSQSRLEAKRQNVTQFNALQAHFLAQGAVQHAMLKFRVLPTEIYTATALARGMCPFFVSLAGAAAPATGPGKTEEPLYTFIEDISTDPSGIPLRFTDEEYGAWFCGVKTIKALTSFTKDAETVNVVSMEAIGWVPMWIKDPTSSSGWSQGQYIDKVTKTVQVRRGRSDT